MPVPKWANGLGQRGRFWLHIFTYDIVGIFQQLLWNQIFVASGVDDKTTLRCR
jgi:hypothetical protein